MKKLLLFFLPILGYGQCDMEILGFDPVSTDLLLVVNGGQCGTEADSIGEFILALGFNPPPDVSPWPCFGNEDWMLLLYPLDFPGFDIGEGSDNILQSGDTLLFNIVEDTPMAGSGTLACWEQALQEGIFFDDCMVLTIMQINDSECIDGSCEGLAGFPYPDENISNNWLEFSVESDACSLPPWPQPSDPEPVDSTDTSGPPPIVDDCHDPCIHVSNAVTPNNDGVNDYWKPITKSECWLRWECTVYNRWGQVVWRTDDPREGWDGSSGWSYAPDGVYVWSIKGTTYRSTKVISVSGHLTLFR
jgi:gliding motility-associated-like protein|tara:strand:+ start:670 stop:1578 length:909 start_codon:yes stop_codon:yes gene_type:complete